MNILLWVLQALLALHTLMGAIWKFMNPVQAVPSLTMIPPGVWMGLGVVELFASGALILPAFVKRLGIVAPLAAGFVAAEMLGYSVLHVLSGHAAEYGSLIYWLVVAALCAFIVFGRTVLKPYGNELKIQ